MEGTKQIKCRRCLQPLEQAYCAHCGQPATLRRINGRYILEEIRSLLMVEKGLFYTVIQLIVQPGMSVRTFLREDRQRLLKPLIFLILTSLIYSLSNYFLQFEDAYVTYQGRPESYSSRIFEWITGNYGYANLIMAVFIAGWLRLFFRKYPYNFFETLILLCFLMGVSMLLLAVSGLATALFKTDLMQAGSFISLLYVSWAIMLFYRKGFGNFLKGFLAYMVGFSSFVFLALAAGKLMDLYF